MFRRTVLLFAFDLLFTIPNPATATDYYFSSTQGTEGNSGTNRQQPLPGLPEANDLLLKPGDRLLFRSGETFQGMLEIDTPGDEANPIIVSRYGEGPFPVLDGNGSEAAIRIRNGAYLQIEQLEITNWKGTYGIYLTAENAGEMNHLLFQDLDIHHVGSESFTITEPSKSIGGICGRVFKGERPSWWNDFVIRRVFIHQVGSCGITLGNSVNLYKLEKDDPWYKPHQKVVIEECRIDSIVRDGIWIRQCEKAVIQHCKVSRTGMNAISNGIWFWDCLECIMQYNEGWECLSPRGNDGAPFSIDNHCHGCIIQFNYSHDNEGPGYMIFGRMGDGYGNILRHNLSYNDNVTRTYKSGTACIAIVSEVSGALVEHNTVVAGPETHHMLGHRNWEGFPHSVTYRNNLFIGNGRAGISEMEEVLRTGTFSENLFINIPHLPEELRDQQSPVGYFNDPERPEK